MSSLSRNDKIALVRRMLELRQANGLTQGELAQLVDVDAQTISRWERETNLPYRLDQIGRLQNVLRRLERDLKKKGLPVVLAAAS